MSVQPTSLIIKSSKTGPETGGKKEASGGHVVRIRLEGNEIPNIPSGGQSSVYISLRESASVSVSSTSDDRSASGKARKSATVYLQPEPYDDNVAFIDNNNGATSCSGTEFHTSCSGKRSSEEMLIKPEEFFYSGRTGGSSTSEAADSGTCSDLDNTTPPPDHRRIPSDEDISSDSLSDQETTSSPYPTTKLELGLAHLKFMIAKSMFGWWTKLLSMSPERLPRICFQRLIALSANFPDPKFNWTLQLKDVLKEAGLDDLENDDFLVFHLNEKDFDETPPRILDDEETFAGRRSFEGESATIRSSRGTIRGVKNRVRAGIATFLSINATKSWQEREAGKVVVYTTTMGIVRETSQMYGCLKVRHILKTNLVKYTEKDVFMSREVQTELRDRMGQSYVELPQVFVEGQHIGDADTVEKLNECGELRKMLKPYRSMEACTTCQVCGGFRLLPCSSSAMEAKSVHRNQFSTELVALKCMHCDENGLIKCYAC
ncbi:hypothetical protein GE061_000798 [Apolygus lucorum]|uniref:Glutaredoxin domain-containing protein n=1 Tax=Apolygus lucorum TaxID=248454 RepID=A0A8S9Y7Z1_APOLU|nr:hypothetical protein GE061_000798 [Apolygus lucorum]